MVRAAAVITRRRPEPPSPDPVEAARRAESYLLMVEAGKAGMAVEDYRRLTAEQRAATKSASGSARAEAARELADAAQVGISVERWRSMPQEERASQAQYAQAAATLRELCVSSRVDVAEEVEALLCDQPGAACTLNSQGCTALHLLCGSEAVSLRALKAVLDAYPPATSVRNCFGSTPLHCLCENHHAPIEAVQLLLKADPAAATETNDGGVTPLQALRERRTPVTSAWGVAGRPATVPAMAHAPPRERTPKTPTDDVPRRASELPGIRSVRDAGVHSSAAETPRRATPRTPRTPRSLRSQRSLQRLRTSHSVQSGVIKAAEVPGASNAQPRPAVLRFRDRRISSTASMNPARAALARASTAEDDESDDFVASFRDKVMNEWVGMPITDPRRYTARSFTGIPAVGSSAPIHLKVDRDAHFKAMLSKRQEEDAAQPTASMNLKEKQTGRLHMFQAAGKIAMAMGEYQAKYSAVRGPVLMGDGNPFTDEQRSVVLVSKREQTEGGARFETTSRHYLKVFVASKVLPQGTSLSKLDLSWIRTVFPFDEAAFLAEFGIADSERDLPPRLRMDAQAVLMQHHNNWLAELHHHGLHHQEDLIELDEDYWDQLAAIPEHAREAIKLSLKNDQLRPSEVFGLPSQIIPLEDAAVRFQANREAPGYGTLIIQVSEGAHPDHPATGRPLRFSSLIEPRRGDTDSEGSKHNRHEEAAAEMKDWWGYIRASQLNNLGIDSGNEGRVVQGVKYAVASMPGEEFGLRCKLTYGVEADFRRAFAGDPAASNLCVWTYNGGFNAASGKWKKNVEDAIADGQKLIVYSRRNWKKRRNLKDLKVSPGSNRSWPGMPIEQTEGLPIDEFGTAQEREIAWLKKQSWFQKSVEFRPIESLDILRSDLGGGVTYVGEWDLDDEIDGHGKKTWPSGDVYEGDFSMALEHGQGRKLFADGAVYDGGWKDGLHDGEGRTTYENGDHYDGTWLKGHKTGSGTMRSTRENGDVYEGESFNGMEHGMGTLTCANGNIYLGSWKKGKMHGDGTYTYANGDVVTGNFSHLKMKRAGEYSWTEHEFVSDTHAPPPGQDAEPLKPQLVRHTMLGEWKVEVPSYVSGRVEFGDTGDWYEGGWERGKRTPMTTGRMRDTSVDRDTKGDMYEGECRNDSTGKSLAHGRGKMHYANGDTYVGEWVNGKREGFGTFTTARVKPETEMRNKYVGTWLADHKHGRGESEEWVPSGLEAEDGMMCRAFASKWHSGNEEPGSRRTIKSKADK